MMTRDLVRWFASHLCEDQKAIEIAVTEHDRTEVLELTVAPDDVGRIIGKGGRTIKALRSVIEAAARRQGRRAVLEVLD